MFVLARLEVWTVTPDAWTILDDEDRRVVVDAAAHQRAIEVLAADRDGLRADGRSLRVPRPNAGGNWAGRTKSRRPTPRARSSSPRRPWTTTFWASCWRSGAASERALERYGQALGRDPAHYLSLLAMGDTLEKLGQLQAAEMALTGAIGCQPAAHLSLRQTCPDQAAAGQARSGDGRFCRGRPARSDARRGLRRPGTLEPGKRRAGAGDLRLDGRGWARPQERRGLLPPRAALRRAPGRIRQGDRRFQQDDRARSAAGRGLLPPGDRLRQPGQVRSRGCRFWRGNHARAEAARSLHPARHGPCTERQRDNSHWRITSEAIRLDPNYAPAFFERGIVLCDCLGEFDPAIADFDAAIRIDPNQPLAYYNRAVACAAKGDLEGALAGWTRSDPPRSEVRPSVFRARYPLLQRPRRVRQGAGRFQQGPPARPRTLDRLLQPRHRLLQQRATWTRRWPVGPRAIQLGFTRVEVYCSRGILYAKRGELKKAIADFDEAIRLDPDYAPAYNYRAAARAALGQAKRPLTTAPRRQAAGERTEVNTKPRSGR